ncbi:hypothetical protein [Nostoc sp. CHAB 5715]|uniref:hypothetical protein n=1 Tax=Nostoc sp. CHAB 5715 TaxID=2780400 RepID=UPI001E31DCFB|nr:hypothetical protein [Nostoc sp. CHAB 5715]
MKVALEKIEGNHPFIISAKQHLGLAVAYAKRYHERQWSIYWKTAKSSTKKVLKQELRVLAFDTYTEFLKATDYLNSYVEEVQTYQPVPPVPRWWDEMLISLILAHDSLFREHEQEISSKQLSLFEELI